MEDLNQALGGLPSFVGQLDLHQHSYDPNIEERLVIRGEEYLELLQVLYMRCEQAMDSQEAVEDLWTLFNMVQRKLTPYIDLLNSNQRDDMPSILNGSLASSVSTVLLPARSGPGVTANLFRSANLFRRNLFASGFVPDFQKISEFVPDG